MPLFSANREGLAPGGGNARSLFAYFQSILGALSRYPPRDDHAFLKMARAIFLPRTCIFG